MATRQENQPFDTATANYKLWTGFIRNLFLTTAGWTATADTGQTNPTTVGTAPTNGNLNYEIYQATDALAGTAPIVVRVEYGQISSLPSISMTVGTGSSGTGTITGGGTKIRTYSYTVNGSPTLGSTTYECTGSGDGGGIRFLMWRNFAGSNPLTVPCFFAIERSRDSSGAATGDYFTLFAYGANLDSANSAFATDNEFMFRQQTILAGGGAGVYETSWLTFQSSTSSAGLGSNVGAVPVFAMPGYLGNPSKDLLCGKGGDFGEASSNTISNYGGNHTYYFSKVSSLTGLGNLTYADTSSNTSQAVNARNANAQGLLFRYE